MNTKDNDGFDLKISKQQPFEDVIKDILAKDGKDFNNDKWEMEVSFKIKNGQDYTMSLINKSEKKCLKEKSIEKFYHQDGIVNVKFAWELNDSSRGHKLYKIEVYLDGVKVYKEYISGERTSIIRSYSHDGNFDFNVSVADPNEIPDSKYFSWSLGGFKKQEYKDKLAFVSIKKRSSYSIKDEFIMTVSLLNVEYGGVDFFYTFISNSIDEAANILIERIRKECKLIFDEPVVLKSQEEPIEVGHAFKEESCNWLLKQSYKEKLGNK